MLTGVPLGGAQQPLGHGGLSGRQRELGAPPAAVGRFVRSADVVPPGRREDPAVRVTACPTSRASSASQIARRAGRVRRCRARRTDRSRSCRTVPRARRADDCAVPVRLFGASARSQPALAASTRSPARFDRAVLDRHDVPQRRGQPVVGPLGPAAPQVGERGVLVQLTRFPTSMMYVSARASSRLVASSYRPRSRSRSPRSW